MSKKKNNTPSSSATVKSIFKWLMAIVGVLAGLFIVIFIYYAISAPVVSQENLQSGGSSTLVDSNGKTIASLGANKRNYVTIDKVPQRVQDAVISIEDKNFYNEPLGIDPIRIVKSAINNVTKGTLQGASTLTQQLIKLTVFSTDAKDQTFKRKMQEAYLAMRVSQKFSKQQILEFYLNKEYFNNGIGGIKTASKYYYGKDLDELTTAQTALLAGIPNAPSNYDPYVHPEAARNRRNLVLYAMYENNKITKAEETEALNTPITDGLQPYKKVSNSNDTKRIVSDPYIKEAITEVKKKGFDPYRDNLKITVNMDYNAQKKLYSIVNSGTVTFQNAKEQVGATIINPNNGKVVAMIGGRNLSNIQFGLNRAVQTSRSNGSTMKPILDYGPAIEYLNWSTYHQVEDTAYTYPGTDIELKDWDEDYDGQISMREALVNSRNIPAVRTLSDVGFSKAKEFAKKLGITIGSDQGLSAGIGSDVSSLQGAAAYAAFSNGGIYYKPTYVSKIETADGITHRYSSKGKRVMKSSTAYMITDMLKGVPEEYAKYADISGLHHAGKTGTTNYAESAISTNSALNGTAKDAWYNGYTKNYSMSIWTGYDSPNTEGISTTYQSVPGKVYKAMFEYLQDRSDSTNPNWQKPNSVVRLNILNNGSTTPIVSSSLSGATSELFVKGYAPNNPYKGTESYSSSSNSTSESSSNDATFNRPSSSNSESSDEENDTNENESSTTGTGTTGNDGNNSSTNNNQGGNNSNNNNNTGNTGGNNNTGNAGGGNTDNSNNNSNGGGSTSGSDTGDQGGTTQGGSSSTTQSGNTSSK
ncbi:transglycosylase domain-containing protein [Companilactobacillus insicii]|uniref:transglycosylase domain-containing protein n=1 Tax=Companilactobacillus insicii TaxID=1732567 RepID=UPI000F79A861|nr:transglycosylase domain-containing protein [Companilactobacillus insicii]